MITGERHRLAWGIAGACGVVVAVVWALIPWEWSWVDDPGMVLSVGEAFRAHGPVMGPLTHSWQMAEADVSWGLFRPAYWVYPSLVYGLPIGLAHVLRVAMLAVAVAGPLVSVRRRGAPWQSVVAAGFVVVSGCYALDAGLFYVSLQELSGAAFIGAGLMIARPGGRTALWVIAAWFKSPFAWFLVADAIVLWRRGERKMATISGLLGVGTLVAGGAFARGGTYSAAYAEDPASLARIGTNLIALVSLNTVLPVLALAWWLVWSRARLSWNEDATLLLIGAIGYAAQLLPWWVAGHYQGGISYTWAVFLSALVGVPQTVSFVRLFLALLLPAAAAALSFSAALSVGMARNATWAGVSACLHELRPASVMVSGELGPEAALRIPQNLAVRYGSTSGTVIFERDAPPAGGGVEAVVSARGADHPPDGMVVACAAPMANVFRSESSQR